MKFPMRKEGFTNTYALELNHFVSQTVNGISHDRKVEEVWKSTIATSPNNMDINDVHESFHLGGKLLCFKFNDLDIKLARK